MTAMRPLERELFILQYHHIAIPPRNVSIRGLYVTPRQFAWQVRQLKNLPCTFLTFETLSRFQQASDSSDAITDKRPWIMLTFDDGCLDVYEHAFPVLQRYQVPAVVYPVMGDVGKTQLIWSENADKTPVDMMTADHIQEMSKAGIEFGSHICQHVKASTLTPEQAGHELQESKRLLEALLQQEARSVAYPFGDYNRHVMDIAARAGYRFGLASRQGSNIGRNWMELCRISVKGTRWYHPWTFRRFCHSLSRL